MNTPNFWSDRKEILLQSDQKGEQQTSPNSISNHSNPTPEAFFHPSPQNLTPLKHKNGEIFFLSLAFSFLRTGVVRLLKDSNQDIKNQIFRTEELLNSLTITVSIYPNAETPASIGSAKFRPFNPKMQDQVRVVVKNGPHNKTGRQSWRGGGRRRKAREIEYLISSLCPFGTRDLICFDNVIDSTPGKAITENNHGFCDGKVWPPDLRFWSSALEACNGVPRRQWRISSLGVYDSNSRWAVWRGNNVGK